MLADVNEYIQSPNGLRVALIERKFKQIRFGGLDFLFSGKQLVNSVDLFLSRRLIPITHCYELPDKMAQ